MIVLVARRIPKQYRRNICCLQCSSETGTTNSGESGSDSSAKCRGHWIGKQAMAVKVLLHLDSRGSASIPSARVYTLHHNFNRNLLPRPVKSGLQQPVFSSACDALLRRQTYPNARACNDLVLLSGPRFTTASAINFTLYLENHLWWQLHQENTARKSYNACMHTCK